MNVINRMLAMLAEALLAFAAVIALLALFGVNDGRVLPGGWFGGYLSALDGLSGLPFVLAVVFSILTILVFLALLILEFPRPQRRNVLLVRSDDSGYLTVEPESVQHLVETIGQEIQGVRQIHCALGDRSGGLVITCWPTVSLGADIPSIASELQNKVKGTVEKVVGVPVRDVSVKARYEAARERRLVPQ